MSAIVQNPIVRKVATVLALNAAILLTPQSWLIRPFLTMFGFGLSGPVKASIAAWLQSHIWGAAVGPGSWFAVLQGAGMGAALPGWIGFVIKAPLTIAAVFLPFLNRNRG